MTRQLTDMAIVYNIKSVEYDAKSTGMKPELCHTDSFEKFCRIYSFQRLDTR